MAASTRVAQTITYRSVVTHTPDGSAVVKRIAGEERLGLLPTRWESFVNELRIGRMFAATPPPVRIPRLIDSDPSSGILVFEAVDGSPLGPKLPGKLAEDDLDRVTAVADAISRFDQQPRDWFYRLPVLAHLDHHQQQGTLGHSEARQLREVARGVAWAFAHGDLTLRNMLKRPDESLVVIDWERAGLYPAGYDHAFLWYTTHAVPGAGTRIEASVPEHPRISFLLSALLITLLHVDRLPPQRHAAAPERRIADVLIERISQQAQIV